MTDIPPRLIELAHRLNEALRQARERCDARAASSPTQPPGLLIPPLSKARQDELHAELEQQIEADLKDP
jgi:hypothetical protein